MHCTGSVGLQTGSRNRSLLHVLLLRNMSYLPSLRLAPWESQSFVVCAEPTAPILAGCRAWLPCRLPQRTRNYFPGAASGVECRVSRPTGKE